MFWALATLGGLYLLVVIVVGRQLAFNDVVNLRKMPPTVPPDGYPCRDIELGGADGVRLRGWFPA